MYACPGSWSKRSSSRWRRYFARTFVRGLQLLEVEVLAHARLAQARADLEHRAGQSSRRSAAAAAAHALAEVREEPVDGERDQRRRRERDPEHRRAHARARRAAPPARPSAHVVVAERAACEADRKPLRARRAHGDREARRGGARTTPSSASRGSRRASSRPRARPTTTARNGPGVPGRACLGARRGVRAALLLPVRAARRPPAGSSGRSRRRRRSA